MLNRNPGIEKTIDKVEDIFLTHEYFMKHALREAERALDNDEVPVGALVVHDNNIIAKSHNQNEGLQDCTAHAEMLAITAACANLNSKFLRECTLYVTLEPCLMCAGALALSRLACLVYGASDPKMGFSRFHPSALHPSTKIISGIAENECSALLSSYFRSKR